MELIPDHLYRIQLGACAEGLTIMIGSPQKAGDLFSWADVDDILECHEWAVAPEYTSIPEIEEADRLQAKEKINHKCLSCRSKISAEQLLHAKGGMRDANGHEIYACKLFVDEPLTFTILFNDAGGTPERCQACLDTNHAGFGYPDTTEESALVAVESTIKFDKPCHLPPISSKSAKVSLVVQIDRKDDITCLRCRFRVNTDLGLTKEQALEQAVDGNSGDLHVCTLFPSKTPDGKIRNYTRLRNKVGGVPERCQACFDAGNGGGDIA